MKTAQREANTTSRHHVAIELLGLDGILTAPAAPKGIVIFAHGSSSSRLSPRNARVASALQSRGLATLLFDLLPQVEADNRANVFDIDLLGARLLMATEWWSRQPEGRSLEVGYFGASIGAAAALVAAAQRSCESAAQRDPGPDSPQHIDSTAKNRPSAGAPVSASQRRVLLDFCIQDQRIGAPISGVPVQCCFTPWQRGDACQYAVKLFKTELRSNSMSDQRYRLEREHVGSRRQRAALDLGDR